LRSHKIDLLHVGYKDRLVVTRAEALRLRGGELSPQQCQTAVVLSTDADVIMFVNLCDNARGKSKNTLNNPPQN